MKWRECGVEIGMLLGSNQSPYVWPTENSVSRVTDVINDLLYRLRDVTKIEENRTYVVAGSHQHYKF